MLLDLMGRVKNINLSSHTPLLPVFEAIKNSFDALDGFSQQTHPRIVISLLRDRTQMALQEEGEELANYPISDFIIEDNGPGFTKENFSSFETSDSTMKIKAGGKGIGRFLWLKAFGSVMIESVYEEVSSFKERRFSFVLSGDGIEGGIPTDSTRTTFQTKVHLVHFKDEYKQSCPKKADTIAHQIIEHFLPLFMSDKCPTVLLVDDAGDTSNLNELFSSQYKANSKQVDFQIKGQPFKMAGVRIKSSNPLRHRLCFCANDREVISEPLKDSIPDLNCALMTPENDAFVFQAFLSGNLLENTVNAERTDFNIPKKPTALPIQEVTMADIRQGAVNEVKTELEPFLNEVGKSKLERITTYIHQKAPQYRPVLKYGISQVKDVPPDLSDDALDLELYKISQTVELEVKRQGKQFLDSKISDIRQHPEYQRKYNEFIEKLNDTGKANIAKYIIHRKLMLDLLANTLKADKEDTYALEESVHSMIFPIRATSDDINYDQHNLWILDEKLAYHYFLASDKRLNQLDILASDSNSRCDLLVFNNPFAFADQKDDFSSVVVVEFKRPMRKGYSEEDDPVAQVYDYVRDLRSQKKLNKDGRPVALNNTPIYAFIVCDITPKIQKFAENAGFNVTMDHKGYFGYSSQLHVYTEVLSYDKILIDSQKRNRVLFEKLNLL